MYAMNPHLHLLLLLLLLFFTTTTSAQTSPTNPNGSGSFRPSVAIVVGVFFIMFALTICLLMYAKVCLCNQNASSSTSAVGPTFFIPATTLRIHSGIDKTVVDSLPFFRFSSIKGARDNLDCAVCLSKFQDTEILRLLPKCKHAFHIDCVDRWLETHSTCPLCRYRIDPEDVALFKYSTSSRFLVSENEDMEVHQLYIERESGHSDISSRKENNSKIDQIEENEVVHKFKHRIIVSDGMLKSRWSNLNSSDLMSLHTDMLNVVELEEKTSLNDPTSTSTGITAASRMMDFATGNRDKHRCMSEITKVTRFQGGARNGGVSIDCEMDGKVRRMWLPIARRTVEWFAGREKRSDGVVEKNQQQSSSEEDSNV